jgi:hypothetical protein
LVKPPGLINSAVDCHFCVCAGHFQVCSE